LPVHHPKLSPISRLPPASPMMSLPRYRGRRFSRPSRRIRRLSSA